MAGRSHIVIAALLGFSAFLLPPSISQAAPPAGACIGMDACTGNTGLAVVSGAAGNAVAHRKGFVLMPLGFLGEIGAPRQ